MKNLKPIIFFFATLSFSFFMNAQCPTSLVGFTALGEFGDSKYFISDGTSTPANAETVTQQNGDYLAVINDQAENDFLQQNISEMV